jgi:hypothetical protein
MGKSVPYSFRNSGDAYKLRRTDFPMRAPFILTSPPTVSSSSTSQISGSILWESFNNGAFSYLGMKPIRSAIFPTSLGVNTAGSFTYTSNSQVIPEFWLDTDDSTGRFEVYTLGKNDAYRIAIEQPDGRWGYVGAITVTNPNDGAGHYALVTIGAAGKYKIRIEFAGISVFIGIQTTKTTQVSAVRSNQRNFVVAGDSYTEPTIVDTAGGVHGDGWCVQASILTGINHIPSGSGGTGFVNPNTGGKVKLFTRLPEILPFATDGFVFAMGINDTSYTSAQFQTEVTACFNFVRNAMGNKPIIVVSPFWPNGGPVYQIYTEKDILQNSARQIGAIFVDLIEQVPDIHASFFTTLTSAAALNATTLQVANADSLLFSHYIRVGSVGPSRVKISNITGTGPYTLSLTSGIGGLAPAAGETVQLSGLSYVTGTGKQTVPTGDGTADRFTGGDNTHPTVAGHANIAWNYASRLQKLLPY